MTSSEQGDLLSPISDLGFARFLLADLHDDLPGKVGRFRQLADLSASLGSHGTMLPGGEATYAAWTEARISFVHGNFLATVLLSQALAEHLLAGHLSLAFEPADLPKRIGFKETVDRCLDRGVIAPRDAEDLMALMALRNPLSHFRRIDDRSNLSRRVIDQRLSAEDHLRADATFAIGMAIRLLALPAFRLGD